MQNARTYFFTLIYEISRLQNMSSYIFIRCFMYHKLPRLTIIIHFCRSLLLVQYCYFLFSNFTSCNAMKAGCDTQKNNSIF